jgi:hypothetical protein
VIIRRWLPGWDATRLFEKAKLMIMWLSKYQKMAIQDDIKTTGVFR